MIPPVAHFIWLGARLPWIFRLSIRSAALRGGFERVVLHHDKALALRDLQALPGFEARRLSIDDLFERTGVTPRPLVALYRQLTSPAARANLLRLAILMQEGGVYLDTDTITVRSFDRLRKAGVFCGQERVALPYRVVRSRDPRVVLRAGLLMAARDVARRLPDGWRTFRRIEGRYPLAANNAVLGGAPGHAFLRGLLDHVVGLPAAERMKRYRLGTHALQECLGAYSGPAGDVVVHPPETFYPLGPEISEHWFRKRAHPVLGEVLTEATHVVHWYASVRTRNIVPKVDAPYVRRNCETQLFSALVRPLVGEEDGGSTAGGER